MYSLGWITERCKGDWLLCEENLTVRWCSVVLETKTVDVAREVKEEICGLLEEGWKPRTNGPLEVMRTRYGQHRGRGRRIDCGWSFL